MAQSGAEWSWYSLSGIALLPGGFYPKHRQPQWNKITGTQFANTLNAATTMNMPFSFVYSFHFLFVSVILSSTHSFFCFPWLCLFSRKSRFRRSLHRLTAATGKFCNYHQHLDGGDNLVSLDPSNSEESMLFTFKKWVYWTCECLGACCCLFGRQCLMYGLSGMANKLSACSLLTTSIASCQSCLKFSPSFENQKKVLIPLHDFPFWTVLLREFPPNPRIHQKRKKSEMAAWVVSRVSIRLNLWGVRTPISAWQ